MAPVRVAGIPSDAAVVRERFILRAANVLQAAIAQADTADMQGAIQRLTDCLTVSELAAHADPEL